MRFLFCGNNSCPEWFLSESAVLTKITAVKMKLVTQYIITNIVDKEDQAAKIFKLLEGSGFSQSEINSTIACINFILENATKYDVSEVVLTKELIDLGLPKENCEYLSKTFKQSKDKLSETFQTQTLKIGELVDIKAGLSQFLISDNVTPQRAIYGNQFLDTQLQYKDINGTQQKVKFIILPDVLSDLIENLQNAQKIMQKY